MTASAWRCAICGNVLSQCARELLVIDKPDRFELAVGVPSAGYRRAWVECPSCGVAVDVLPAESMRLLPKVKNSYYAIDFPNSSIAEKFEKVMALDPASSDNAQRVERVLNYCRSWFAGAAGQRPLRALDIGAGMGVFPARFLEKSGPEWTIAAVESDPLASAHLKGLKRFEVVEDVFPGKVELGQFNLVTLNKVLEHFSEPLALLRSIAGALDPWSGIVYIEVPDKQTIGSRPPDDNILGALHHHLYDLKSLNRLVEAAGFAALRLERIVDPSGKLTVFCFATTPAALEQRSKVGA